MNLFVGGFLVYGSLEKFTSEIPSPTKIIEQVKKGEEIAPNEEILVLKNYIFGMKQTGYFWPFLGIAELLAGLLLISQFFAKMGAIAAVPITLNIFLFHIFLEPNHFDDLIVTTLLFFANGILIGLSYPSWKQLLVDNDILKLRK